MDYVGSRYVPKIYENSQDPSSLEWESGKSWEPFIIVTFNLNAYISKKIIPPTVGDPASNPAYWAEFGFYNGQIASLNSRVTILEDHASHCFETIDDVDDVEAGDLVLTRGYSTVGDGGGNLYVVTASPGTMPTVLNSNGIYLMVLSDPVNIKSVGCILGDSSVNNAPILNNLFNSWPKCNYYAPCEDLYITDPVIIPKTFKGEIQFTGRIIVPSNTGRAAIHIKAFEANKLYIKGVYGSDQAGSIGILIGSNDLDYHVGNNTLENGLINGFETGLKLEASNGYGVFNNKFYLCRIDNCDYGVVIETIGNSHSDGFINQNQFYNLWVTGDGNLSKTAIKFIDNTPDHSADYNEDNFFNLSGEGCKTIVKGDGFNSCAFMNIRLNEQGPIASLDLFDLDIGARNNIFTSDVAYFDWPNITDAGSRNRWCFHFYDRATAHSLGNEATFTNGRFCLKGATETLKVFNVGGVTTYTIPAYKSASYIHVNRVAADPVDIIMPNNAKLSNYAPTLIIKIEQIGGGVRFKDVDGNFIASTDGSGGVAISANHTYIYYVNYDNSVSIQELI